ncbi:MAG TPA: serine protease [Verrucomicrobiota bacterium]|nr:serine protease [Verrucomicrobiota bacterium]HNU52471.1 serine protease [Verrucomicrobiota bacterium]
MTKSWVRWIIAAAVLGAAAFVLIRRTPDTAAVANRASQAVGFLGVEYALEYPDGKRAYSASAEGTAFLVERTPHHGLLLTCRHVAAPWLADPNLAAKILELQGESGDLPRLRYRHFLCFHGAPHAFRRFRDEIANGEFSDYLQGPHWYRSDAAGGQRLEIAGVARLDPTAQPHGGANLPDDVAVLRIFPAPAITPLATAPDTAAIQPTTPVLGLGFPYGAVATGVERLSVSVSLGHVRRWLDNTLEVHLGLHEGCSGGPVLDRRGRVIGLAAAVANGHQDVVDTDTTAPQSDLGLVLPIARTRPLLEAVRNGSNTWNGYVDPLLPTRLERLGHAACRDRFGQAAPIAESLAQLPAAESLTTAALFFHHQPARAGALLEQASRLDPLDAETAFYHALFTWRAHPGTLTPGARRLLAADWRAEHGEEFYGLLLRILAGALPRHPATLTLHEDATEKALLYTVVALLEPRPEAAESLLREALLAAAAAEAHRPAVLIRRELDRIQTQRAQRLSGRALDSYRTDRQRFNRRVAQALDQADGNMVSRLMGLLVEPGGEAADQFLAHVRARDPENLRNHLVGLAFRAAFDGRWTDALRFADQYLALQGGRATSANRLGMGLFRAQLQVLARRPGSGHTLRAYLAQCRDPFYRLVAQGLLDQVPITQLRAQATDPPRRLVLCTALALHAEATGRTHDAVQLWLEALDTPDAPMLERELARERLGRLRP